MGKFRDPSLALVRGLGQHRMRSSPILHLLEPLLSFLNRLMRLPTGHALITDAILPYYPFVNDNSLPCLTELAPLETPPLPPVTLFRRQN